MGERRGGTVGEREREREGVGWGEWSAEALGLTDGTQATDGNVDPVYLLACP